jgi:lambda family phage tail tape measure protein
VSDFKLKVIAETQTAERSLKQVGEVADKATKARSLDIKVPSLSGVTKTFQTLERDVKSAANTINTFYKVGKALPGNFGESVRAIENVGKGAAKSAIALNNNNTAAEIFSNTLKGATGAAGQLVTTLAKVGFATFAIKETVGLLQAAFTGFFNNTIGREVKLRETILKTQTTLASTNKVFKDGKEITDPYQKIVTLTGAVRKNIDSIRERSIALAGVTSGEVIEVFGIVASQVGQIGGGLKEAEDLAINFAAALGTFGIPLYQARQEVGSILRGDITVDSYLAKALGITNEDIAKAKTATGGVVKFLEERLAAAVAGQRIAAEGFSGVVSNIKDLGELIGQNFGTGMLQPLLHSLTAVFETLFRIRTQIFDIASKAGETIGRVSTVVVGLTAGRTGVGKGVDASAAASAAAGVANKAFTEIETVAQRTVGAISQVIAALQPTALILADAFRNIVEAFVQIKVGTFEALASALANIATAAGTVAPAFATIFNLYARFLNTPIVKYFAEVATVLALLKRAGLDAATSLLLFGKFVVSSVIPALGVFGTAAGAVVAGIAAIGLAIGKLVLVLAGLASALVTPAAAIPAVAAAFQALSASLTNVGNQAVGANTKLAGLSKGLTALGATAKAAGGAILASLGWVVAFQVGIAVVVDALGRYQRAQEDKKSSARAAEALRRLQTTYKDVGDSANSATKAARDFEQAIVNAQYDRNIDALEKVREKINQIRYELKPGIQSWGEFWAAASGEEMGKFEARAQSALAAGLAEEAKLKAQLSGVDAQRDRKLGEENVELEAQKRVDLSKEYAELQRQQQNDLFQQRQTLAQKEVEIFRAAGELRIFQMEQANAKLIEGEEGASRTALEALNNYLSVRENGELEIEAAKKDIAIEVANLEKTIADYRFENEKKIAEIRKRAAANEKAMADAQRQAEGQGPRVAGGGAFDTGLRTGPAPVIGGSADYHQDLSFGPGVDLRQQRELMVQLAQSYDAMGRKIVLSNAGVAGREFPLSGTAQQQNEFILNAQSAHRNRPGGGRTAIDFYAPTKTDPKGRFGSSVVNQPMLAPTVAGGKTNYFAGGAGGAGVELTKDGQSILKLIHGRTDIPLPSGGSVAGAPGAAPTPALQSLDLDDLTPAAEAYAAAVRGVASAMERFRALQAALTEAQTVAAFEAIAKAAFPQVQLEGYEDNLFTVQETYDAVAASAAGAFDPERAAITIDRTMKIAAANREVKQILDEVEKRPNITEKERNKLADDLAAKQAKYLADLAKEEAAKLRILAVQRATDFITQTQADTKAIYDNIEVLELRNRLRFEGVDPAVIAGAEALLLNERRMVEATKLLNEQLAIEYAERDRLQKLKATADAAALPALQKDLDDALAKIAKLEGQRAGVQATGFAQAGAINAQTAAETEPGAKIRAFIGDARRELADLQAVAVRVSQSIGDAIGNSLANGITGLIEGTTTAKQVFADFLKSIGQMLVQEGTKMIAMYIAIAIAKAFAGMSGGGGNPVKPGGDWMSAVGRMSPNANGNAFGANGIMPFAKGGAFTNSIVSSPTLFKFANGGTTQMGEMGEAGPEAIMPLSRGRGGRLGVDASGLRSAMGRPPGGATTTPVLNMSFQSTTINGVEYVSRDQLEAAMAETRRQAAKEGASRGMDMTLDKIQNSPSTRSRVGIR